MSRESRMQSNRNPGTFESTKAIQQASYWSREFIFKGFIIVFLFLLLTGLIGCRSSFTPYDYCSPVYTGNNDGNSCGCMCDPLYRSGSKLYGTEHDCKTCGLCGVSSPVFMDDSSPRSRSLEVLESDSTDFERKNLPNPVLPRSTLQNQEPVEEFVPAPNTSARKPLQPSPALPGKPFTQKATTFQQQQHQYQGSSVPITLEEIKRTDPNAVDVRILNVEDGLAP